MPQVSILLLKQQVFKSLVKNVLLCCVLQKHQYGLLIFYGELFLKPVNNEPRDEKIIIIKLIENIRFLQDFNNVNLKWLCFWTCNSKGDCRDHLFSLAFNELMAGNNDSEKKIRTFLIFLLLQNFLQHMQACKLFYVWGEGAGVGRLSKDDSHHSQPRTRN